MLWTVIDLTDRGVDVVENQLYAELTPAHPDLTRARFDEIVELLVLSGHLRKWTRPGPPQGDHSDVLIPTAKSRLQLSAVEG
jgi:hypothetical protein